MAASFGSMLQDRRRQMGLSIQQVANAIKIRPQIIEFFENGDFNSMPPRGYAQGMISSYARYLGLNPSTVVDAYLEELHAFESAAPGQGSGRFQDAAADASPRSANAQGRYYMVDGTSRYGQRPPQAGYVSESTSLHEPVSASRLKNASIVNARDPQAQGRPAESVGGTYGRQRQLQGGRDADGYGRSDASGSDPAATGRIPAQGGRQRRTAQGGYEGSGSGGGYGSRGQQGGYQTSRPRGARDGGGYGSRGQQGSGRSGQGRSGSYNGSYNGSRGGQNGSRNGSYNGSYGRGSGRSGGLLSGIDPRFVFVGGIVIALLMVLLVSTLVRGCTSSETEAAGSEASTTVSATTVVTTTSSDDDEEVDDTEAEATDDADADDETASAEETESDETIVTVEIADGAVAYLEVQLDGVSVLGSDQAGPVELTYTVEEQIVITTDSPSDVKVYLNGEKVSYDVKTSGVGKVTITADEASTTDDASDTESE